MRISARPITRSTKPALLMILCLAATFAWTIDGQAEQPNKNRPYAAWELSYESAVRQSRLTGRPIMLVFSGSDWCGWCQKLAHEIFHTHEFARWSTDHVIKVEVDFPQSNQQPDGIRKQNQWLKEQFGKEIQTYPTILFVDANGQILGKTGYVAGGPHRWIKSAKKVVKPRRKPDLVALK